MQLHAYILLLVVQEVVTNSSESNTPSLDSTQPFSTTITSTPTTTTVTSAPTTLFKTGTSISAPQGGLGADGGQGQRSSSEAGRGTAAWAALATPLQVQHQGQWPPSPGGAGITLAGVADRAARPLPQEGVDNGADVSGAAHTTGDGRGFSTEDTQRGLLHNNAAPQRAATEATSSFSPGTVAAETAVSFSTLRGDALPTHTDGETVPATATVPVATTHTGVLVTDVPTSAVMQLAPDRRTAAAYPTQRGSSGLDRAALLPPSVPPPSPPPPPPSLITSPARPRGTGTTVTQRDGSSEDERSNGGGGTSTWRRNRHRQATDRLPPTGRTVAAIAESVNAQSVSNLKDLNSSDTYSVTVAPSPSQRPVGGNESSNTDSSELDGSNQTLSSLSHDGAMNSLSVVPDITDETSDTASNNVLENEDMLHTLSADPRINQTATPTITQNSTNFVVVDSHYLATNTSAPDQPFVFSISSDQTKTSPETNHPPSWAPTASPDSHVVSSTATVSQREPPPHSTMSTSLVRSSDVTMTTASSNEISNGEVFLGGNDDATQTLRPRGTAAPAVPSRHASSQPLSAMTTVGLDENGPADVLTDGHSGAPVTPLQTVVSDPNASNPTVQGVGTVHLTHATLTEHRTMSTHSSTLAATPMNTRTREPSPFPTSTAETSPTYNQFSDHSGSPQTTVFPETLVVSEAAPGTEPRGGERDEDLVFMTSAPSQQSTPPSLPARHTPTGGAPERPSPRALPDPRQEHLTTGTPSTSTPEPSWNVTTTQPPRFYIVPDQPAAFRVESMELLLQIIVEDFNSDVTTDPEVDMEAWIEPYLLKAPGFSKLLGIWSRGLVVQSLMEFETRGAVVWLGKGGPDSLLECTGLAQAVWEGRRFRGSKVTNITVGGLQGPLCDWLLQCPAGFQCVSRPGGENHSCSSVCNLDYCHHHGICTHHPGQLPVCRCLAGDHFWFMGQRCDVRMTRARLVGACLAVLLVLLTLVAILALVAVRRYRAMLIQAKVNQTRSSYRRFNHFDELSGRFWLRSTAGSADSLDNHGFTRSDELLHLRALDRTCCYHDDTLSLASTCPSNGTRIHTVFPHSSHYGWRGSDMSMVDCVLDSGKASDLSVCSWPVEPIHWTPFPLLQQLASHRPTTVRASRTRSYCEGMELVDMGKSWTA
ncbi:mucin-2 [Gadus macrocephalus]|uniref:mucin-2 n=1 Tax=Gadus macrocephalus TaxID=80720 RepID=UPI0028CB51DA|nr:mucin-2 [Gadus macrocephalus]